MNRGVGIWLLLMIVPFLLGMLIQFIVPLQFILDSHAKVEQSYNFYKSQVEQNTVRAVSYLNSRTITNKLQLYANLRSSLARLFDFGISYLAIQIDQITLNSAYQLANANASQLEGFDMQSSMWYAPNTFDPGELNAQQIEIYREYRQIEPFINSYLSEASQFPEGILSIETYINYKGSDMYFRYPSAVLPQFAYLHAPIMEEEYNATLINYEGGYFETNFNKREVLKTCTPFFGDQEPILGMVCFEVSTELLLREITQAISSVGLKQVRSQYFMLLPIYPSSLNQNFPLIIANFTVQNISNIDYSFFQERFFPLDQVSTLSSDLFTSVDNYVLNVNRAPQTIYQEQSATTFYIIPIATDFTFFRKQSIGLYLLIMNTEVVLDITTADYFHDITMALTIPTILLILLSILGTTFILKRTLKQLDQALQSLNEYSMLILKGDLDLEIGEYAGTQDLAHLFEQFQVLNLLNKYSDPMYFDVPKAERIIKYLKVCQLFDLIGYSKVSLYENIADCYFGLGDNEAAIKYISEAIEESQKVLFENGESIQEMFERKLEMYKDRGSSQPLERRSKERRLKEKNMRRMLLKCIKFLYQAFQPGKPSESERLAGIVEKLKQLTFPRILNNEYIAASVIDVRSKFRDRSFAGMEEKLKYLDDIITGYEDLHLEGNEDCKTPPDIMRAYFRFMNACWFNIKKKPLEAFKQFARAMGGKYFHPLLHKLAMMELRKILEANRVDPKPLGEFFFLEQYKPRGKREYIFLVDISNPKMEKSQIKQWKNSCRKTADYIFQKLIYSEDRLAIYNFWVELQICFNLAKKQHQPTIMKKEIFRSFRCKEQIGYSHLLACLRQATQRVRNLKEQKVFIIFMKEGLHVDGKQIAHLKQNFQKNSKFIFLTDSPENIMNREEDFFVMKIDAYLDLERVLSEKKQNPDDSKIYIF